MSRLTRFEEQVIVLPQHPTSTAKNPDHQVIIVPTAATGLSTITRKYPQIISFYWPDKKADGKLQGRLGEGADPKQNTYLSVFKNAVNERLAHYQKTVIDLTCEEQKGFLHCDAALSYTKEDVENKANFLGKLFTRPSSNIPTAPVLINLPTGHLYFLDTGLLFLSVSTRVYLPKKSFSTVYSIIVKDIARAKKGEASAAVCLDTCMSVGEPFFESKISDGKATDSGGQVPTPASLILGFTRIPLRLINEVEQYFKKHEIELCECEQIFYDYDKDQPCTGWSPRL